MSSIIRNSAQFYDWEGSKHALLQKLIELDPYESGELCINYFNSYLMRFDEIGGNHNWLTQRLAQIQNSKLFSTSGIDLSPFPDMSLKFDDPRIRTVKWALFFLWSGARFYADIQLRASKLTEATASMITVYRVEHPAWIPEQYNSSSIQMLDRNDYCKLLWWELADKLSEL